MLEIETVLGIVTAVQELQIVIVIIDCPTLLGV
jgi:hypothetical protein